MSMQRSCPRAPRVRESFEEQADLLRAAADPYRLKILAILARAEGEVCVCDFTDALPLNQPTVSHHLRLLREAGLVDCERRGTWVYYRLARGARQRLNDALASALRIGVPA
jgi:ArsR family transcriptional regulator, arsenate/arsenite/antimonite-responsive transcriptional repressor